MIYLKGRAVKNKVDQVKRLVKNEVILRVMMEKMQPIRHAISLNVAMFWTSREHLRNIFKENIFKQIFDGKVVFVLKMYDWTKKNVDILANFSNHKAMFPEYLKNIPRISVSKSFQGYPQNIARF